MSQGMKTGIVVAGLMALTVGAASAQDHQEGNRGGEGQGRAPAQARAPAMAQGPSRPAPQKFEQHAGPTAYQRVTEPQGWNARPAAVDRTVYNHNYKAARTYNIGAYRRPNGWVAQRWSYGQYLPAAYWTPDYLIRDYWLFALEVPPAGYEWVRDDDDAILVNVGTGEIAQVEYGVFS